MRFSSFIKSIGVAAFGFSSCAHAAGCNVVSVRYREQTSGRLQVVFTLREDGCVPKMYVGENLTVLFDPWDKTHVDFRKRTNKDKMHISMDKCDCPDYESNLVKIPPELLPFQNAESASAWTTEDGEPLEFSIAVSPKGTYQNETPFCVLCVHGKPKNSVFLLKGPVVFLDGVDFIVRKENFKEYFIKHGLEMEVVTPKNNQNKPPCPSCLIWRPGECENSFPIETEQSLPSVCDAMLILPSMQTSGCLCNVIADEAAVVDNMNTRLRFKSIIYEHSMFLFPSDSKCYSVPKDFSGDCVVVLQFSNNEAKGEESMKTKDYNGVVISLTEEGGKEEQFRGAMVDLSEEKDNRVVYCKVYRNTKAACGKKVCLRAENEEVCLKPFKICIFFLEKSGNGK